MTLQQIFVFAALGLLAGRAYGRISRPWLLFAASVLAVFWLQPAALVRGFDFWLPAASLGLAALVWALTLPPDARPSREDKLAAAALAAGALLLAATRYLGTPILTASRPPQVELVAALAAVLALLAWLAARSLRGRAAALGAATLAVLAILVALKAEPLARGLNAALRSLSGQDPALATALDLNWLGFSYIAFRLVHALRDRAAGRLAHYSLRDFVTYIVFFPALTAGPIERVERFVPQLHASFLLGAAELQAAGRRLVTGLFMKFVLADALAYFALNPALAAETTSTLWMWLLLIAYAWRIFFDFAGYTHIAIGLGLLFGVRLPENFARPYSQPNLTAFWNSWHITLAQWFRAYFFNPLTRFLRTHNWPVWAVVLVGQVSTMALIGLWHGITWNFLIWGLWHGVGLFVHSQFAAARKGRPAPAAWQHAFSVFATFIYVALGWVWFVLPQPAQALQVLRVLLGLS
ncbi:MAG: MBOAT family protein [Anaerolineales bacterium]|nr:MAG: MBOAT family protein [Anaerolineales bacterium]